MSKSKSLQKRQEWEEKIRLQSESGLTIKQWCQERDLSSSVFHYWKGILRQLVLERSSFTELPAEIKSSIILEYSSLRIYLENDFDANALKRCLSVLKEGSC